MDSSQTIGKWEKRWHPLREEWVVYSAHRNTRPWQGAERVNTFSAPAHDANCYLCPGNKRVSGMSNPAYRDVYIFENDHPVVGMSAPAVSSEGFYKKERAVGKAKVVCFDPRHNVTLSQMKLEKVVSVFKAFKQEMAAFKSDPTINSVLIFENKGEAVGVSNPHPHCQIYAVDFPLKFVEQQLRLSQQHKLKTGKTIFDEIIDTEVNDGLRIIAENENAIAFIPFFARYAYEVMVFPKKQHATLISFNEKELHDLVSVFHEVIRKLDMNYDMNFPYVMSIMQAPVDDGTYDDFRMHLWLQPPFRQPGLIKYLAGPEIGAGNFMADTMPEEKADELRSIQSSAYPHEQ